MHSVPIDTNKLIFCPFLCVAVILFFWTIPYSLLSTLSHLYQRYKRKSSVLEIHWLFTEQPCSNPKEKEPRHGRAYTQNIFWGKKIQISYNFIPYYFEMVPKPRRLYKKKLWFNFHVISVMALQREVCGETILRLCSTWSL